MVATPTPSVSVALCTYKGARFIRDQLQSILEQSMPVTEVVIGDDGSDDDTVAVALRAADDLGQAAKVRVAFTSRVGGVAQNFERTLAACTGDLIALSDQDDVWHPDRVERAVARFRERDDLLMLAADARIVDANGVATGGSLLGQLRVSAGEADLIRSGHGFDVLVRRNVATGATAMLRRSLLTKALPIPQGWIHDEWLAIVASAFGGFELLAEPLIDYRIHGGNQIGVAEPTLRRRIGKMLEPRGDRLVSLASRSVALAERVLAMEVPAEVRSRAMAKRAFEERRAAYPANRAVRVGHVLRTRGYRVLSSQGTLDIARDLVQRAS